MVDFGIHVVSRIHMREARVSSSAFSRSFARGFSCCRVSRFAHDASTDLTCARCAPSTLYFRKRPDRYRTLPAAVRSATEQKRERSLQQSRKETTATAIERNRQGRL